MEPLLLTRHGQLLLYEENFGYRMVHVVCKRSVDWKNKPGRSSYMTVKCKCGTSKKSREYLGNIIKLLTR